MRPRIEYVIPVDDFEYTNSCGHGMTMEVNLYITEVEDCWNIWVGADDYGHRIFLLGIPTTTTLEEAIELGTSEYFWGEAFQEYVLENE